MAQSKYHKYNPAYAPGEKFGKLTILREAEPTGSFGNTRRKMICQCECGNITHVPKNNLSTGNTKSCGCGLYGGENHRATGSYEYGFWSHLKERASKGRVTLCPEWASPSAFLNDLKKRPSKNHVLLIEDEREIVDKNNIGWLTRKQRSKARLDKEKHPISRNASKCKHNITANGETMRLSQWAEKTGIKEVTLRARLRKGMSHDQIINTPHYGRVKI